MLATLGSYVLFMGVAIVLSGGSTVTTNDEIHALAAAPLLWREQLD